MNNAESSSYLCQQDLVADYPECLRCDGWTTLYKLADAESARFASFSALASPAMVPELLESFQWDLQPHHGRPEISWDFADELTYHRYGHQKGVRPIVLLREFSGSYPEYLELAEEFRVHHNLAEVPHPEDRKRRTFFKIEDCGGRIEVARVTQDTASVKSPFLQDFLEATNSCLVLYIDSKRYLNIPADTAAELSGETKHVGESAAWIVHIGGHWDHESDSTYSRFLGKAVVR